MKDTNIFEYATRKKLRFPFRGMISAEEVWDLSMLNLDLLYKTLMKSKRDAVEDSLMADRTEEDSDLLVKIAIVKHIFSTKKSEKEAHEVRMANKAKAQRIMQIQNKRADAALEAMSDEELDALLKDLE